MEKEEIKRGMKHFIGLSNGSYVDCYYKHYKDHVLVMRPNPNAKKYINRTTTLQWEKNGVKFIKIGDKNEFRKN